MEIIAIIVAVAVLWFLWGWIRWLRYGRDPRQHELAAILAEQAQAELAYGNEFNGSSAPALYTMSQAWSEKERVRRLLHASTVLLAEAPADVQRRAEEIAKRAIEKLDKSSFDSVE